MYFKLLFRKVGIYIIINKRNDIERDETGRNEEEWLHKKKRSQREKKETHFCVCGVFCAGSGDRNAYVYFQPYRWGGR